MHQHDFSGPQANRGCSDIAIVWLPEYYGLHGGLLGDSHW